MNRIFLRISRAIPGVLAALLVASAADGQALDLTLADAIERALASHETLDQAQQAIAAAEAGLKQARAGRLPHLEAASQYTFNAKKPAFFLPPDFAAAMGGQNKVEMGGDYDLTGAVTATLNLWTAGRISAAIDAAREGVALSQVQARAVRDYVRFQTQRAYFSALLAEAGLRIAEQALIETEEAARVARAGHAQGTVSRFDLSRSEVELANRRAPLTQARNAVDQAHLALKRICGFAPTTSLALRDSLESVPAPEPIETLLERMHARSPELQALARVVNLRTEQLRLQKAARGPALQLSAQYVWQGQWDEDVTPEEEELATSAAVALGLQVPIFDGLETKGRIEAATAALRDAELELSRARRDRELAIRQARLELSNALVALEGRREAVSLAEEAHRLALVRLANGLATPLERLDAEVAMSTARAQLAEVLYAANLARASLDLAIGYPSYEGEL